MPVSTSVSPSGLQIASIASNARPVEHSEPRKQPLVLGLEQLVAPGDRRLRRVRWRLGRVARTAGEEARRCSRRASIARRREHSARGRRRARWRAGGRSSRGADLAGLIVERENSGLRPAPVLAKERDRLRLGESAAPDRGARSSEVEWLTRLVTRNRSARTGAEQLCKTAAAASTTCSKLSRTSSSCFSPICAARPPVPSAPRSPRSTSAGSRRSGARSANQKTPLS